MATQKTHVGGRVRDMRPGHLPIVAVLAAIVATVITVGIMALSSNEEIATAQDIPRGASTALYEQVVRPLSYREPEQRYNGMYAWPAKQVGPNTYKVTVPDARHPDGEVPITISLEEDGYWHVMVATEDAF